MFTIVNIKGKKPIRQAIVENRMLSITPFSKKDVPIREIFEKRIDAGCYPLLKFFPLARSRQREISSPVLESNISLFIERDSQIGAVHFFLNRERVLQKLITFRRAQDFVVSDLNARQSRKMRGRRKLKKIFAHVFCIFFLYLSLIYFGQRKQTWIPASARDFIRLIALKHHLFIGPELNSGIFSTGIKDSLSILRLNCLFEHHQKLSNAGFTRTVGAKEEGDRRHRYLAGILPALKVLNSYFF